jgi:hypothetical protein
VAPKYLPYVPEIRTGPLTAMPTLLTPVRAVSRTKNVLPCLAHLLSSMHFFFFFLNMGALTCGPQVSLKDLSHLFCYAHTAVRRLL